MPTSGDGAIPYIARYNLVFKQGQLVNPPAVVHPMTIDQFIGYNVTPPASTPRSINVNMNDLQVINSAQQISLFIKCLIASLIGGVILLAVVIPVIYKDRIAITSNDKTDFTMTYTTTTTITTTTNTDTTTTATCASGYSQAPTGSCVNLQIDFNNCGSFGYVCNSNYTSCSADVCSGAPAVQLVGAISVPGWGGQFSVDDAYLTITFPVNMTLYNYTTTVVSVTSNGVVCLDSCSAAYSNGNLPDGNFGGVTAFGYWDDLMIYSGTSETVYYNVDGTTPNRITTFEFYESHYGASNQYYHFQILFYENLPNIVKYVYFDTSDGGVSATIGVQSSPSGPSITYSVDQANSVTSNLTLIFDTNAGTYSG